jgi:predicted Zn-ribbon and HTH transcriptional regulator
LPSSIAAATASAGAIELARDILRYCKVYSERRRRESTAAMTEGMVKINSCPRPRRLLINPPRGRKCGVYTNSKYKMTSRDLYH